jgi:acyl carrier protein
MTARLGAAQFARMRRAGLRPMPVERGMALLDEALARAEVGLVAMHLDLGAVQHRVDEDGRVPALFRTLVRPGLRRVGARGNAAMALRRRLSSLAEKDRVEAVVAMVQEMVAAVLGLADAAAVPSSQPLKELGLDSLMAVEIRNQLSARAETTLPVTLVFDYPTPQAIATLLLEKLGFASAPVWSDSQIRTKLSRISIPALRQMGLVDALMQQPDDLTADELLEYPADAIDKMDRENVLQALDLLFR